MAAMTSQLLLEMQPLLGRGLAVGLGICWQQPACTGGAVAEAGGSPRIPRPPALYLHRPCSLPMASGPHASLPIAPDPWWPGDKPWGAQLVVVVGDPRQGAGVLPRPARALSADVGSANTGAVARTSKLVFCKSGCPSFGEVRSRCSPGAPSSPRAGVRAGEAAACAHALSSSTWRLAEPSGSAPLRRTCTRCTGAEGNRFPSVSCAAAEP